MTNDNYQYHPVNNMIPTSGTDPHSSGSGSHKIVKRFIIVVTVGFMASNAIIDNLTSVLKHVGHKSHLKLRSKLDYTKEIPSNQISLDRKLSNYRTRKYEFPTTTNLRKIEEVNNENLQKKEQREKNERIMETTNVKAYNNPVTIISGGMNDPDVWGGTKPTNIVTDQELTQFLYKERGNEQKQGQLPKSSTLSDADGNEPIYAVVEETKIEGKGQVPKTSTFYESLEERAQKVNVTKKNADVPMESQFDVEMLVKIMSGIISNMLKSEVTGSGVGREGAFNQTNKTITDKNTTLYMSNNHTNSTSNHITNSTNGTITHNNTFNGSGTITYNNISMYVPPQYVNQTQKMLNVGMNMFLSLLSNPQLLMENMDDKTKQDIITICNNSALLTNDENLLELVKEGCTSINTMT